MSRSLADGTRSNSSSQGGTVRVLVTGGGTAGHVEPALAVARALGANGVDPDEILFVGARRGMEARLVPAAGFAIRLLPGRGIVRRLSLGNARSIGELGTAFLLAIGIVARERPKVVVMVGGYAGLACSLAALIARVPVVVVNVDAEAGIANRLVGRFATLAAVASESSGMRHAVVTGPPVRAAVLAADHNAEGRATARAELGLAEDRRVIAIVGGSLGAGRLNEAALYLREHYSARGDLAIYHVAGARNLDQVSQFVEGLPLAGSPLDYRLVGFEPELPALFAASDLVVTRAGAMTVAELSVIGSPSVLVPLPGAPGDHQSVNARSLEGSGGAILLPDAEASGERLAALIDELLGDPERLEEMGRRARTGARPNAAAEIASLVASVLERTPKRRSIRRLRPARLAVAVLPSGAGR